MSYEIVLGLRNNMQILMDNYDKYERMYKYKYNIFLSLLKVKI